MYHQIYTMIASFCVVLLLAVPGMPAAAQPPGARVPGTQSPVSQSPGESRDDVQAPPPSPESLARIRRALTLDRQGPVQNAGLSFREEVLLPDERPRIELPFGPALVSGVDRFSRIGPPVPGAMPGHWDMMAAMTPRNLSEVGNSDVLGIATASAVSAAAIAFVPAAVRKIGGWLFGDRQGVALARPLLTASEETLATHGMTADDTVLDAGIDQYRGRTVVLSLVVAPATSPTTARELGERFVRLVKTLAPGEPVPGVEIGAGVFDYIVQVTTPSDVLIAQGGKASEHRTLQW